MKNLEKYRALLEKGEVDALLLTSPFNRMYAAQYNIAEGAAVIAKNRCYYFTDSRYIEAAEKNLPDFTVQMVDLAHDYSFRINAAIEAETIKTFGIEENDMTYGAFRKYQAELHAVLKPYNAAINQFRASKEPWELELMRQAQKITDETFTQMLDVIKAGMSEKAVAAELIYRLYKNGADGLSFQPIVISGPNTSLPHGVPGERILQYGDFVTMDFGCLYKGYCSDMTRTVALGFVTEEMDKVYNIVLAAQLAGIAATKAGVTGRDIDGAARKVIADAGYGKCFGHGYGHSLGLEIHEAPNCSPSNDKPMPAGAVSSAEPGIYLPDKFGVRIEDVTVITENGCEIITKSPKNLIIL
jgi:Xaa-Pro aminopeptidase